MDNIGLDLKKFNINLNNLGQANNEIDAWIRFLNDRPIAAMARLGYSKTMRGGGDADFVSQELVRLKELINK